MKKTINFATGLLWMLCSLTIVSCNKDFLELKPSDEFSELDVFQDPALAEAYVNDVYKSVNNPVSGWDGMLKGEFVDEAHDMWYNYFEFNNSLMNQDNLEGWFFEKWPGLYSNVRKCNVFLEKIRQTDFDNAMEVDGKPVKERLSGEVHFLRAYFYHQLVSLYGGVPIIKDTYSLTDDFKIARNTYAECIDFIVAECDSAADMLPEVNTGKNKGRATKGAALALKSEVLLYAASDLHDNNPLFAGFSSPELLGYVSGDQQDRWRAAKNAAAAVINLGLYSLFKADPAAGDDVSQNYSDVFLAADTEEDIFVRYSMAKYPSTNNLPLVCGPNGYHLYGQNTPIGNLVDDYEMADGTKFRWENPAHAAEPYKNREPRFYSSILYDGAKWISRNTDGIAIDPIGIIQTGTWERWDAEKNEMVLVYGLDTRNSPIEPWNGGYTGYYLRKFIDPKYDGRFSGADTPWRYLRYGEVLLNYAEACIELGEEGEARASINMIRKRAGMLILPKQEGLFATATAMKDGLNWQWKTTAFTTLEGG